MAVAGDEEHVWWVRRRGSSVGVAHRAITPSFVISARPSGGRVFGFMRHSHVRSTDTTRFAAARAFLPEDGISDGRRGLSFSPLLGEIDLFGMSGCITSDRIRGPGPLALVT